MSPGYAARLCLLPSEVRLDPCDSGEFVLLCEDSLPKVTVLDTGDGSSLEDAGESVGDIATVQRQVQTALGALQFDEDSKDRTRWAARWWPGTGPWRRSPLR